MHPIYDIYGGDWNLEQEGEHPFSIAVLQKKVCELSGIQNIFC